MTDKADTTTSAEDTALAAFFEDARAREPMPDSAFLGRILADAAAAPAPAPAAVRTRSLWSRIAGNLDPIGGWGGATALAASAILGLGVGLTGAGSVEDMPGVAELSSALTFDIDTALADYTVSTTTLFDDLEG